MKKIAIMVMILLIIAVVIVVQIIKISSKEQSCISSGGIVGTSMCCKSASDFPNNCLIGACGCSPENSHEVKTCVCPEGKCFNGNKCA